MDSAPLGWRRTLDRHHPGPVAAAAWLGLLAFEVVMVLAYVQLAGARLSLFHVYPFVWINLSIWVLWRASAPTLPARTRWIAAVLSGGYFLVLAYLGGLLREGHAFHAHGGVPAEQLATGFTLHLGLPPGYGPALTYSGEYIVSAVSPYMLLGFIALTYLVYLILLDASRTAAVGLAGVFSCVGCSFPLIVTLVSGSAAMPVVAFAYSQAYTLSTIVFAATILVLYWRPFEPAIGSAESDTSD